MKKNITQARAEFVKKYGDQLLSTLEFAIPPEMIEKFRNHEPGFKYFNEWIEMMYNTAFFDGKWDEVESSRKDLFNIFNKSTNQQK